MKKGNNMEYVHKNSITTEALEGRGIKRIIGKHSHIDSERMTVGYATYSEEYGAMIPHAHAEESIVVTDTKDGYFSWGDDKNKLCNTIKLDVGMVLHIPKNEWHVFHYDADGFVEIIFIYGEVDDCRPEDKNGKEVSVC